MSGFQGAEGRKSEGLPPPTGLEVNSSLVSLEGAVMSRRKDLCETYLSDNPEYACVLVVTQ